MFHLRALLTVLLQVLQAIDFSRITFDVICMEYSYDGSKAEKAIKLLKDNGYIQDPGHFKNPANSWFHHPSFVPSRSPALAYVMSLTAEYVVTAPASAACAVSWMSHNHNDVMLRILLDPAKKEIELNSRSGAAWPADKQVFPHPGTDLTLHVHVDQPTGFVVRMDGGQSYTQPSMVSWHEGGPVVVEPASCGVVITLAA